MSEHPSTPKNPERIVPPEMRDTVATLTKDFRMSFKFSQGNLTLQNMLFGLVRDEYQTSGTFPQEQLPRALTIIGSQIGRFVLPPKHQDIRKSPEQEFGEIFDGFKKHVLDPDYITPDPSQPFDADRPTRLAYVTNFIKARDLRFIGGQDSPGRPGSKDPDGKYESQLRTYILGEQDTNSAAYNAIFREARQQLVESYPNIDMGSLPRDWELHHPEQNFFPEKFLADVAQNHS